jgi:hypothetical protein
VFRLDAALYGGLTGSYTLRITSDNTRVILFWSINGLTRERLVIFINQNDEGVAESSLK